MPRLLTIREAADWLGVSPGTVYRWARSRPKFRRCVLRIGGVVRINPQAVERAFGYGLSGGMIRAADELASEAALARSRIESRRAQTHRGSSHRPTPSDYDGAPA